MAEVRVGAADVFIKDKETGVIVYLGLTDEDGSTTEYGYTIYAVKSAQYGDTPIEMVVTGDSISLKANFLDTSLENIARLFPTATIEKDQSGKIVAVTFGGNIGQRLSKSAVELICHPIAMGMDTSEDIIIYKAANTGKLTLTSNMKKESIISAEFTGMPDFTRPPKDQLFRIGQPKTYTEAYKRIINLPITPSSPKKQIGQTVEFTAMAYYEDGTSEDVTAKATWASATPAIASIAVSGGKAIATAASAGVTVIQATYSGNITNTTLTVES